MTPQLLADPIIQTCCVQASCCHRHHLPAAITGRERLCLLRPSLALAACNSLPVRPPANPSLGWDQHASTASHTHTPTHPPWPRPPREPKRPTPARRATSRWARRCFLRYRAVFLHLCSVRLLYLPVQSGARVAKLSSDTQQSHPSMSFACDYSHKRPLRAPRPHGPVEPLARHSHSFATCHPTSAYPRAVEKSFG